MEERGWEFLVNITWPHNKFALGWIYTYEVDLEKYLKRKLGFNEWDSNWDVGLHLKGKEIYLMLSKRNNLGSFQELEKVKYSKDLDADSWIMDCLVMYKS